MKTRIVLGTAALATVLATGFGTAVLADRGGQGPGRGGFDIGLFDAIDADKDGRITQAEIDAHRAARVAAVDADSDGKISLDELKAAEMARMTARVEERAARMLARMDSDGDGFLTAAEMATPPMPARMLDRLDTDGDGAISRAEAEAARNRMAERGGDRDHRGKGQMHGN